MGVASVIATFVMCILFNIILPTGDVYSDINLMYLALNFDLDNGLELEGCKSCYFKTEEEVYHPKKDLKHDEWNTFLYDPFFSCGTSISMLEKLREFEANKNSRISNETFRLVDLDYLPLFFGECDEKIDHCCATQTKEMKKENQVQKIDPKKLIWPCHSLTEEFDYCIVTGKESAIYCSSLTTDLKFVEQFKDRFIHVSTSTINEKIFFYRYSRINHSFVMEEKTSSITDSDVKCGLLFYRHNNNNIKHHPPGTRKYKHYFNQDVCLTHLKSLHFHTSITDLAEWRNKIDHIASIKVGGVTCRLLQIYGTCILIPIILNLSFNIVLFINDFREKKANIFEVIPVILLVYPQYKTLKFLSQYIFIHRDENLLNREKEENDRTVAPLEPFLESCFQVNISLAILYATEGFFRTWISELGTTGPALDPFSSALPLISFLIGLVASSFGMSKFFLSGPIQFLPNNSAFNGILSMPFLSLCIINSMFGFRIICIESSFFSNYVYRNYNLTRIQIGRLEDNSNFTIQRVKKKSPLIPPEYRLLVYLAPCIIPLLINGIKLWCTTKGSWQYFMKYPQFLISPCFIPFMFEGNELNNDKDRPILKIWKRGTIINAIYIGCIPQLILCITDYYKGVHQWPFESIGSANSTHESSDALFKSPYGNTIFATVTALFFLILITIFFGTEILFKEKGLYCRCLTILCCPCPEPCIKLHDLAPDPLPSLDSSSRNENEGEQLSIKEAVICSDQPKTEVYVYRQGGKSKLGFKGQWSKISEDVKTKVEGEGDISEENSKSMSEDQLEKNPDEQEVVIENNLELLKIKTLSSSETDNNTEKTN